MVLCFNSIDPKEGTETDQIEAGQLQVSHGFASIASTRKRVLKHETLAGEWSRYAGASIASTRKRVLKPH